MNSKTTNPLNLCGVLLLPSIAKSYFFTGAACVHNCPLPCFMDLKEGEKLNYARSLLHKLTKEKPGKEIRALYDISCRLKAHLKVIN